MLCWPMSPGLPAKRLATSAAATTISPRMVPLYHKAAPMTPPVENDHDGLVSGRLAAITVSPDGNSAPLRDGGAVDPLSRAPLNPGTLHFDLGILPVGRYCDLRCRGAFRGCLQDRGRKHTSLTPDSPIIETLERLGFSQCFIGGGEPTLNPQLRYILHRLSKTWFIRYVLTHGYSLTAHLYLAQYIHTIKVSVDPMHKRAMERRYTGVSYPSDILSAIQHEAFREKVCINSVLSSPDELPFFYALAQVISRATNVVGRSIYRNVNGGVSDSEHRHIIDELASFIALPFHIQSKPPSETFIQILVSPDRSIESCSFDREGKMLTRHIGDLSVFDSKEDLLAEVARAHDKSGAFVQLHAGANT